MKKLLIVALENEFNGDLLPEDWAVVYTGVGKVNAAIYTCVAIGIHNPDIIVNYGTAGGLTDVSGLIEIKAVLQRDMDATPLAERGLTPGEKIGVEICDTTGTEYVCATGDSFVTEKDPWLTNLGVDVVDMEAYAIAKVADYAGIPFRCWKYISDNADESAADVWEENAGGGEQQFLQDVVFGEFSSVRRRYH